MRRALVPLLALELAGATWQLLDLTRALPTGSAPGDEPVGGFLVGIALLAFLLEASLCFFLARRRVRPTLVWLAAPIAGAFALGHIYAYDSYCGGYGCRFLDEMGAGAERWTWAVAAAGVAVGVLSWRRVAASIELTAVAAILTALTVFATPLGH